MSSHDALLAAILVDPAEDTPRLAYADWLEERAGTVECPKCHGRPKSVRPWKQKAPTHTAWKDKFKRCECGTGRVSNGYAARAEFIRVQVERARIGNLGWWECEGNLCCGPRGHVNCRLADLRCRERELLEQSWAGNLDLGFGGGPWTDLVWTRGFVSGLSISWSDWRTHAAAITAAQPVERCKITDICPVDYFDSDMTMTWIPGVAGPFDAEDLEHREGESDAQATLRKVYGIVFELPVEVTT